MADDEFDPIKLGRHEFTNGMTIRQLKRIINNIPEANDDNGEEREVWLETGMGLSSPAKIVSMLNVRTDGNGKDSSDILICSTVWSELEHGRNN